MKIEFWWAIGIAVQESKVTISYMIKAKIKITQIKIEYFASCKPVVQVTLSVIFKNTHTHKFLDNKINNLSDVDPHNKKYTRKPSAWLNTEQLENAI